jgi:hypothetical protein
MSRRFPSQGFIDKEVKRIDEYFNKLTSKKISMPNASISTKVRDVEWYSNNTIFINPEYIPKGENISYKAMLAHGFFHHVQSELMHFYKSDKIRESLGINSSNKEKIIDLLNNFVESSAMFFAAAYLTRNETKISRNKKILCYLSSRYFLPPKGKFFYGNSVVLSPLQKNKYNVRKTILQMLTYKGVTTILKNRLKE